MNSKNVYVSSCCDDGGIYRYKLKDGLLSEESRIACKSPMYTIHNKGILHILLKSPFEENENSGIFDMEIAENGNLVNPRVLVSTMGECGCHLCTLDGNIYAANYISGSVVKLPDTLVTHEGKSVHPTRQEKAHTHYVCQSPDGKYILAVDLGMDMIFVYDKNLKEVSRTSSPAGNGPRHLIFSDDGKICYCADELSSTVSVYKYSDGKLTYVSSYSCLPEGYTEKSTLAAIRQKDGYVYASNRGHDSVAVFKADGEKLERINIFSCKGNGPRDFDITENTLICTNENDGSITVFDITDKLNVKHTQKLNVPKVLCVTIV